MLVLTVVVVTVTIVTMTMTMTMTVTVTVTVRMVVVSVDRRLVVAGHALSRSPRWCGAAPTTCSACFTASITSSDACSSVSR